MGTKNRPGRFDCYENASPDEPIFILLARDASAADLVEAWANRRQRLIDLGDKPPSEIAMVEEARACAESMRRWRATRAETSADEAGRGKKGT